MSRRICRFIKENGEVCRAAPMRDSDYCFLHDPESVEAATEARRLGGKRRRREKVTSVVYDLEGLGSAGDILRLLEITAMDTLSLENSVQRNRTLAYVASVAQKVVHDDVMEERVRALEAVLGTRLHGQGGGRR